MSATPSGDRPDGEIRDTFIRGVVPVVMLARDCEALHASAVALGQDRVVALCAASGTGKSTLALAMAGLGASHFADDTVVYQIIDDHPVALSLPFPVRVDAAARGAQPEASKTAPGPRPGSPLPISRVYQLSATPPSIQWLPSSPPCQSLDGYQGAADALAPLRDGVRRARTRLPHTLARCGQAHRRLELPVRPRPRRFATARGSNSRSRRHDMTVHTAGIALRLWAWAALLRPLKHVVPLGTLVRLAHTRPTIRPRSAEFERRLETYLAAKGAFPQRAPANCLERSLGAYRMLCAANAGPTLCRGPASIRCAGRRGPRLGGR